MNRGRVTCGSSTWQCRQLRAKPLLTAEEEGPGGPNASPSFLLLDGESD